MKRLIKFFLFAYLLVFPFGQFTRLNLGSFGGLARFLGPEVRIYLGDILVGLMVGIWGIKRAIDPPSLKLRRARGKRDLAKAILVFAGVATLSLVINLPRLAFNEALVASFYLFRWIVYAGLYFVTKNIVKTKNSHNPLLTLLILVGGITAVFGLLQYFFFPDLRGWLETGNWDPHYYRAYGTFMDPGFFGMIMVLALILVTVRLFDRSFLSKFIPYTLYSILYTSLAFSYSRASYLAFLVGMGVISWRLKKPKFYGAILGFFLITILLLPRPGGEGVRLERQSTIEARIRNWKQSFIIAKDHPILGVGFNAYRYAQRDYEFLDENWQESHAGAGADSSLFFVLATMGIVGLISYLYLWRKIFITHHSLIVLASLSALLVHSFFLNSLFYPWIMGWMWILLGASGKYDRKNSRNAGFGLLRGWGKSATKIMREARKEERKYEGKKPKKIQSGDCHW